MNLSQEIATILATRISGVDRPILIIADNCNLMLSVAPIKSNEDVTARQRSPDEPHTGGKNSISSGDDQKDGAATVSEPPNPSPSASPLELAPTLRQHFNEAGAMNTKQVCDRLINSGEYVTLENQFGVDPEKKIRTALSQLQADGFLTRPNKKKGGPYIPTEKLYDMFKTADAQESNSVAAK